MARGRTREATGGDLLAVRRVLDAAMLSLEGVDLRARIGAGDVLVREVGGRIAGVLVLDGDRVAAVAVSRERRDRGHGRALVEAAAERRDRLTAGFGEPVRPFYEALGFAIERRDGRLWGRRER